MSATTIVDIVLAVIAAIIIIKFTVKGFVSSVLDTLKVIFAAAIAYLVRRPVAQLIDDWFMNEKMVGGVRESLLKSVNGNDSFINFVDLYKGFPSFFNNLLAKFGLGDVSNLEKLDTNGEDLVDGLALEIGSAISMFLSTILAVIVMFLVSLIVLSILVKIFDALTNIPAIKVIDRILGFVLGLALAVIILHFGVLLLELLIKWTNGFGGQLTLESLNNESMLVDLVKLISMSGKMALQAK